MEILANRGIRNFKLVCLYLFLSPPLFDYTEIQEKEKIEMREKEREREEEGKKSDREKRTG